MDEHEDRADDEEVDDDADEADEAEVEVGTKTAAATTPRAGDEEVESNQDILVKQEARAEERQPHRGMNRAGEPPGAAADA